MATWSTRLTTWLAGKPAGRDQLGNRYFTGKPRRGYARERRWVLYAGEEDASRVPPEWHAWLHYTVDQPPAADRPARPWLKEHQPNLTGTEAAYRPQGSIFKGGRRAKATGDYEAWTPPGPPGPAA